MYDHVLYETSDGVARITINRPEKLNAYTSTTIAELTDAYRRVGTDHSVGVVVLTGAGERAFCAGGDIEWEVEGALANSKARREVEGLYAAMRESLRPTIARINGYAIGGGHHLAYMCDLSIASENAIFGQNGPRVGSPCEGWMSSYLIRVIGAKRAREIWFLCRRYPAAKALEWGLVNAVVPQADLDAEVNQWCEEILSLSPTVIKILKKGFDDEFAQLREFQDPIDYVMEVNPDFFSSGEQQEGGQAFLEKRPPEFARFR
jgi:dihydroxynaphthoic acid synthetase